MFLENNKHKGWIEVICGSMFSGKTEELIRRMKRAQFANLKVEIFKPSIDGLKISTLRLANCARFMRRISSSVLPENIEPQITSIQPLCLLFSKNIYSTCMLFF